MTATTSESVHCGIQLPIQAQSNIFVQPWERTASVEDLAAIARTADDAGFSYIGVCDHVAIPERLAEDMGTTWYDNVATLGWLAAFTTRTHLLSHVHIAVYRHPAQTAHAFATLDHLSGGRVILGVGAGHVAEEFALFGADFEKRGPLLDDRIAQIKAYLENEFVDGMGVAPRPAQKPHPPIWIGGSSTPAIRRAALHGDGWLPQGPPAQGMTAAIALIHELRAANGRNAPFAIGAVTAFLRIDDPIDDAPANTLTGSPDLIAANLRKLIGRGVTDPQVRFAARNVEDYCDQMQRFAVTVAPMLND